MRKVGSFYVGAEGRVEQGKGWAREGLMQDWRSLTARSTSSTIHYWLSNKPQHLLWICCFHMVHTMSVWVCPDPWIPLHNSIFIEYICHHSIRQFESGCLKKFDWTEHWSTRCGKVLTSDDCCRLTDNIEQYCRLLSSWHWLNSSALNWLQIVFFYFFVAIYHQFMLKVSAWNCRCRSFRKGSLHGPHLLLLSMHSSSSRTFLCEKLSACYIQTHTFITSLSV